MYLEFGSHRFDISHRAVVVGSVDRVFDPSVGDNPLGTIDTLLTRAELLASQGADALDIGAVSHHAGDGVTEAEERALMVPAVAALRSRFELPLWFATRRATVAASCFDAGAEVVEDGSGFADPGMLSMCARAGASVVIVDDQAVGRLLVEQPMASSRSATRSRPNGEVATTCDRLAALAAEAAAAGIPSQRVMVDPALTPGYGDHQHNHVLRAVEDLTDRGHRVVMSVSGDPRQMEDLDPGNNDAGNVAVAIQTLGIARGCRILRTDDIRIARRVSEVLGAVLEHR